VTIVLVEGRNIPPSEAENILIEIKIIKDKMKKSRMVNSINKEEIKMGRKIKAKSFNLIKNNIH